MICTDETSFFPCVMLVVFSFWSQSQNLVNNADFSAGSLTGWGAASGTTIGREGGIYFAVLHGENGVLYQRVTGVEPGKTYECKMSFKNLLVKQTTGYGFAIEKGSPLTLPVFTIGASNLKTFCESNSGVWTVLPSDLSEQNTIKSYSLLIPDKTTAVHICLGTKGAVSDMQVKLVELKPTAASKIIFSVQSKTKGTPVADARINIDGFANQLITNADGLANAELAQGQTYKYTVGANWYAKFSSEFTVSGEQTINVQLDTLREIKEVKTRISKYGDNATPYPVFGHFWSAGLDFSDVVSDSIVRALDYIVGGSGLNNSKTVSDKLHQLHPDFQIIRYQGGWDISAAEADKYKMDLLYYRCGVLSSPVSATENTIVLSSTPDNKGMGLVASEPGNFTTWLRIENELMKIVSVSSGSYPITVTVERGFSNTVATAYSAGKAATAPLYITIPVPGGNNANLSYFEPVFGLRKTDLLKNAVAVASESGQDGIWIDILVGLLGAQNMKGGTYTLWDHNIETLLTNEVINDYTKTAVNEIYNGFYSRMGYYPVIYGNNVLFSLTLTPSDRAFVMVKNTKHPRDLDGFCHENSWGHMTDEAGSVDNDGQPVNTADKVIVVGKNKHYLEWYRGNTWLNNCRAVALLAENNLPNQPMTINAGFKNQWFAADLETETRYAFHKFSYASYLMCVNVTLDSLISCRMGISPQVVENGKTGVRFEPFFYYQVGIPKQNNSAANFAQYRVGSENLYSRRFTGGLVLINPFVTDMVTEIPISQLGEAGKTYIDPENKSIEVQSVRLKAGESKILLLKPLNTSLNQTDTQSGFSMNVYPVPASNEVTIDFGSNWMVGSEKADLLIYDSVGNKVSEMPVEQSVGKVAVSVRHLKQGSIL
jgi:hypothetical protein